MKLAIDAIVDHASRVANPKAAWFQSAHSRGPNQGDATGAGLSEQKARLVLRHALSDDGDGTDAREIERLHNGSVHGSLGSEVDHRICLRVCGDSRGHIVVDRQKHLRCAPVELLDGVSAKGVDHSCEWRGAVEAAKPVPPAFGARRPNTVARCADSTADEAAA
eukprot:scaffold158482_cov35-Tisochrysis_lutea.AAC.3